MTTANTTTVVRAVTLPVAAPVKMNWSQLDDLLKPAFRFTTDLANWAVHLLYRLDTPNVSVTPDVVKYRSKDNPKGMYLYGEAVKGFPEWETRSQKVAASAQCVFQAVHRKYLQDRFAIMCRHDQSLLTYRYPQPFPVHNQNWQVTLSDSGSPVLRIKLPGRSGVELRLKAGWEFRRQIAMVRQFLDGSAKKGEVALYRDRKGNLLAKMVGHFPRQERGEASNVCFLHTDPNTLLVAEINGRQVSITNGDHLRRAHAIIRSTADRHRRFLQRVKEDKKREVRMDAQMKNNLDKKVEDRCGKQRDRMKTAVYQIAAQVARFCERQKVGLIAYDDSVKDFLPDGFQWHAMKTRLCQKFVGEMGGEWVDGQFTHVDSEEASKERREWLTRARALATAGTRATRHKKRKGSHPSVTLPNPAK
jgi:hypothetical protein